jgi:hypothetical protein
MQLTELFGIMIIIVTKMIQKTLIYGVLCVWVIMMFSTYFYVVDYNKFEWTTHFAATSRYMVNSLLGNYVLDDQT